MRIILLEDFKKLGQQGDICSVADGYARNFLIPKKIAIEHSPANIKLFEQKKKQTRRLESLELERASQISEKLSEVSVSISMKAGENNQLFGSVTTQDIAELLAAKGFEIDRRKIELPEAIKTLGTYTIHVNLHSEVKASVQLWVNKES